MSKHAILAALVVTAMVVMAMQRASGAGAAGPVVNTTTASGHHAEPTIAVNPLNPNQQFMASVYVDRYGGGSRFGGLSVSSSSDGGATWTAYTLGTGSDGFAPACCDPSAAWDSAGNLFLVYLGKQAIGAQPVELLRSSTGTAGSWTLVGDLEAVPSNDQPTVAVGSSSVWVTWHQTDNSVTPSVSTIVARGASVTGPGAIGAFSAPQAATGSDVSGGEFGDIAVGPSGQVVVTYQAANTIFENLDADGLGVGGFGPQTTVTSTGVGTGYAIPAQALRTIDAEITLQYDRSGGVHNGRLYAAYSDVGSGGSSDTDSMLRYSDDNGTTWSAPLRVNDDTTANSQFLPHLAIDQGTGAIGVSWYDARNVASNDAAQVYATFSIDGGVSVAPNVQVTSGISNMTTATTTAVNFQFGDYRWSAFVSGTLYVVWADNSNSTGDNPNGAGGLANIYTAALAGPIAVPTPTTTSTFTPTATATSTATPTATATPTPPCADVNRDGVVTIQDVTLIVSHLGSRNPHYDVNHDRIVSLADVLLAISELGQRC